MLTSFSMIIEYIFVYSECVRPFLMLGAADMKHYMLMLFGLPVKIKVIVIILFTNYLEP